MARRRQQAPVSNVRFWPILLKKSAVDRSRSRRDGVTEALVMAMWRRGKPDTLMHHSDRGSQDTSEQFGLMADHGVGCWMNWSGNVWDNAAMESFFSSLKTGPSARNGSGPEAARCCQVPFVTLACPRSGRSVREGPTSFREAQFRC
jgi:transposase InsO family protein